VRDEATEAAFQDARPDPPQDPPQDPPVIPGEPDRGAPLFFVSHANARNADTGTPATVSKDPFATFFTDLSENVSQLVYRPTGADPGFIDRRMRTGVRWEQEILTAVGTCQVLIALVSDPYAHRPWCGKEWDAFTRRRTWRRADRLLVEAQCVIPVIWAPSPDESRPKAIATRQLFVPDRLRNARIGEQYVAEGIFGLLRVDPEAYEVTVWRLAQEIQERVFSYWVEPSIPTDIGALRNLFAEEES
jgi:TIR domain